jgi:hypothetical protein
MLSERRTPAQMNDFCTDDDHFDDAAVDEAMLSGGNIRQTSSRTTRIIKPEKNLMHPLNLDVPLVGRR